MGTAVTSRCLREYCSGYLRSSSQADAVHIGVAREHPGLQHPAAVHRIAGAQGRIDGIRILDCPRRQRLYATPLSQRSARSAAPATTDRIASPHGTITYPPQPAPERMWRPAALTLPLQPPSRIAPAMGWSRRLWHAFLGCAGPATGSQPPLRRGRSRSACVVNARLQQTGKGAVRRAPPCVVSCV